MFVSVLLISHTTSEQQHYHIPKPKVRKWQYDTPHNSMYRTKWKEWWNFECWILGVVTGSCPPEGRGLTQPAPVQGIFALGIKHTVGVHTNWWIYALLNESQKGCGGLYRPKETCKLHNV